ncbi:centromere/kinetochore protein zw10 homolog [Prorops nasuta]|uniref:centromere/kinetochore protein zw10 homolog n=1 Tax=Prorops nasuta TaxID=863751 RepID=UPI0034CD7876
MTSFVNDVLHVACTLEKDNLPTQIFQLKKEIAQLSNDVKEYMNDNHNEFLAKLTDPISYVIKTNKLIEKSKLLQIKVDEQIKVELLASIEELKNLKQTLKESEISLQLSNQLLTLQECISTLEELEEDHKFLEKAGALKKMKTILSKRDTDLYNLDIYKAIDQKYSLLLSMFLTKVSETWNNYIQFTGVDKSQNESVVTLTLKNNSNDMEDLLKGLHCIDDLTTCLARFSIILMEHIINPVINYDCLVYVMEESIFKVEVIDRKRKPSFESVLYNLTLLFKLLHKYFNILIDNETLLRRLQPYLLDSLSTSLKTNCISYKIPTNTQDIRLGSIITAIEEFQLYLIDIGFISKNEEFLSEYINNIDQLIIQKTCQELFEKARNIIKKDLHDSIKYESPKVPKLCEEADNFKSKINRKLSLASFHLPPCLISKNAKELLNLAKHILNEASNSSEIYEIKLLYACRNIFEMYGDLTLEHHKQYLETIPQQQALFHNNCMYLAHHLLTLSYEYKSKQSKAIQEYNFTFVDQTLLLRDIGSKSFLDHMIYQRNIITDILKESGLTALGQSPELDRNTERALRQCIRQLELLKTVWMDVLPMNVYCRAVGRISNSMINDLVMKVVSVEDIPAGVASELVVLFNMIVERTPAIFPEPSMVQNEITRWNKFLELIKILGATLKEIEYMWTSGTLAQQFSASEVKQLIRALFQNTERRANLLDLIKSSQ